MQLTQLKGIGPKTEESFLKLGVHNVEELLQFFPRDYELFSSPDLIGQLGIKSFAAIRGAFTQKPSVRKVKNLKIVTAYFKDETGTPIRVVWFNSAFIKDTVQPGKLYVLRGRITQKYGVKQIEQPRVIDAQAYQAMIGKRLPIYPLTKGINNNQIVKAVKEALRTEALQKLDETDPIPELIKNEYGLCKKSFAVKNLHFPEDPQDLKLAAQRMSFEEIFLFLYYMKKQEHKAVLTSDILICEADETRRFIADLPFELTEAQKRVYGEMMADMSSGRQMSRLIQGDVGSGKTAVALFALMNAAYAGYQGALMAPTEVLAAQHYETISALFKEHEIQLHAALLTGSMSALEKKVVYDALESGRIDIIIGTHALIQEKVKYKNLGLVITDEQHRFGINQRASLAAKAHSLPHMAVMSATPIPRTLALILYGGMDVSVIDEMPLGRKAIKNAVIDDSYRDNAYRLMKREIARGHQVYIICPLVEYTDGLDAQNVTDYTQMIKEEVFNDGTAVGMLHGQMSAAKKNEVMEQFAAGKIKVLVSTTVVEVGVNVPNATVMMIEDANRFGLAALHQLRGRVGRGSDQSYCLFMSNNKSKEAMERLNVLKESVDGFKIAAEDLKMRGPGEFTGLKQSGMLNFRHFDICTDVEIAKQAVEAVKTVIEKNLKMPDVDMEQTIIL